MSASVLSALDADLKYLVCGTWSPTVGEIRVIGGARIGIVNATWPFAKLSASPGRLRLASVLDSYDFEPQDVVALERYGPIPLFYNGIRVVHARPDYPSKIIFWCFGSPDELINRIREAGFLPTAPSSSEIRWRGIPCRWASIFIFILVWNGLFLLNGARPHGAENQPGMFILAPLLFAFLTGWGIKRSPTLQTMVLNDRRSVNEVKGFLTLIQVISALLFVVFAILLFAGVLRTSV